MQAVRGILHAAGFDMNRYREESFVTPIHDEPEIIEHDEVTIDETHKSQVTFTETGKTLTCQESDAILAVAKEAGRLRQPTG